MICRGGYVGEVLSERFAAPVSKVSINATKHSEKLSEHGTSRSSTKELLRLNGSLAIGDSLDPDGSIGDLDYLRTQVVAEVARDLGFIEYSGGYLLETGNGIRILMSLGNSEVSRIYLDSDAIFNKDNHRIPLFQSVEFNKTNLNQQMQIMGNVIVELLRQVYAYSGVPAPEGVIEVDPYGNQNQGWFISEGIGTVFEKNSKDAITFDDIGGQPEAKEAMQNLVTAINEPARYEQWGMRPPKGVLLYGPPGNGKTLFARAVATAANARFVSIAASDVADMWYGESEKKMAEVFDDAAAFGGPSVIFFDEIDALSPTRNPSSSEASVRVLNTLLNKMDGIGSSDRVFCIGATNNKEIIDSALLRPGRFDRKIEVPPPDFKGRRAIVDLIVSRITQKTGISVFEGVDTAQLALNTDLLSGSEVTEALRRAVEQKVILGLEPAVGIISQDDILRNIEKVRQEVDHSTERTGQYM